MHAVAATIAFLVLLGVSGWLVERSVRKRVLGRMQGRPARTPGEFGRELFPPEAAQTAAMVREILGRHLALDLSRLDPEDTFEDLEIIEMDSLALVEFAVELEREFGITISHSDAARIKTVREVVEYISRAQATAR